MKQKYKYFITKFLAVFAIFTFDQAAKYYMLDHLKNAKFNSEQVNQFLNFTLIRNQGISFGFFNNMEHSNLVFLLISLAIVIVLGLLLIKSNKLNKSISYILVISGALGNIFDRIERGAVIDFIELHYEQHFFPVFNIADAAISIGVFLLMIELIFVEGKHAKTK